MTLEFTTYDQMSEANKQVLEQMARDGHEYLWQRLQMGSPFEQEELEDWAFKLGYRMYEKRGGEPFTVKTEEQKEEEKIKFAYANGKVVEGEGQVVATIVTAEKTLQLMDQCVKESKELEVDLQPFSRYGGRLGFAQESTYLDSSRRYHDMVREVHRNQIKSILHLIPKGKVIDLAAGQGILAELRSEVESYDKYPASESVKQGDINEVLHRVKDEIVFIQYGYVFLNSASRQLLRNLKYIVIDDEEEPIYLEKKGLGLWSNVIQSSVAPDRVHKKSSSLWYTENLLLLKQYRVYTHNEYVRYKYSYGHYPSNEGPYLISSLKEYVRFQQDVGGPCYYAPAGRVVLQYNPAVVADYMFVSFRDIHVWEGRLDTIHSYYYEGTTFFLPFEEEEVQQKNDQGVLQWRIKSYTENRMLGVKVDHSRLTIVADGRVIMETIDDPQTREWLGVKEEGQIPLHQSVIVTDEDLVGLAYIEFASQETKRTLQLKGLIDEKGKKTLEGEGLLENNWSKQYSLENTIVQEVKDINSPGVFMARGIANKSKNYAVIKDSSGNTRMVRISVKKKNSEWEVTVLQ